MAVNLDGRWQLSDPTWASTDVDDEGTAQHERHGSEDAAAAATADESLEIDDYYYLPSAAELLPTHLPRDARWQLLDRSKTAVTRDEWDTFPKIKPVLWKAGLAPVAIPRGNAAGDAEAVAAMEAAESALELCEATAGGREGWRSLSRWVPWSSGQVHCTQLHQAGRRAFPSLPSAFDGTSGEWEVARFQLRKGASPAVDLLPKVWEVDAADVSNRDDEESAASREMGWHSLASVRREGDTFSVHVVLPARGMYALRIFVALPDEAADGAEARRSYAQAVDFLLDASAASPLPHWTDCATCIYPRMFGAAGAVTLHAPRQRRLKTGHDFNIVLELPSYAREQTLVVRDSGSGREVQLHRTTVGAPALLDMPTLVRPAYAGSFRCVKEGTVTVFTRLRGERSMQAMIEFECSADGHAPVEGSGGVLPPSNVAPGSASVRCERLACLPVLDNLAFVQDAGVDLGLTLASHTAASFAVAAAATTELVITTEVPSTLSGELKESGIPDAAQHDGIWTLVSSSSGGTRHVVALRCRRPWRYELDIFAAARSPTEDKKRWHALVVRYTVDASAPALHATTGQKLVAREFPKTYSEFAVCECELFEPRTRQLAAGRAVNVSIAIGAACNATAVALIPEGSGAQWTHLEAEQAAAAAEGGDTVAAPVGWRGVVEPSAGPLRLAMRLPPSEKQYQHVLEWHVVGN